MRICTSPKSDVLSDIQCRYRAIPQETFIQCPHPTLAPFTQHLKLLTTPSSMACLPSLLPFAHWAHDESLEAVTDATPNMAKLYEWTDEGFAEEDGGISRINDDQIHFSNVPLTQRLMECMHGQKSHNSVDMCRD